MCLKLKCLFIDDSDIDVEILIRYLKKKDVFIEYSIVETAYELQKALVDADYDFIISDHNMYCLDSVSAITICKNSVPDIPCVVFSMFVPDPIRSELENKFNCSVFGKDEVEKFYLYLASKYN